MTKRPSTHVDENGISHWTEVLIVDDSPENADWIKVAGWFRTFSEEERHLLKTFKGCSSSLCNRAWLAQRQYRLSHGKRGTEIVTDPDIHTALLLMRAAGIPCDRMHPDDDWNFPGYMKEPVPDVTPDTPGASRASSNYHIDSNVSRVTAWGTACIPFGPRCPDWRLGFRNELKSAVLGLSPVGGKVLYAAYRSPIMAYADVENLLIYNVLGDTYNAVTRNGLVFERFCEMSRDSPVQLLSTARHQYEYALVDEPSWPVEGQDNRLLASLSFESTISALGSCAGVWHAVKTGSVTLVRRSYVAKPWGISITIDAPSSPTITCSKIVKHLMDGIASALHCHDGSDIDYLSEQLGKSPGLCDEASARSLLLDSSHALFGATNLLYRYRESSGVKWNPKDEYCTYCSMRCRYSQTSKDLRIIARIFDTEIPHVGAGERDVR